MTGSTPLPALPRDGQTWLAIGFLAVPATAVAMIAVSWAQPRMTAARAAVALTLEPAASAVTAAMLGTELDTRMILGGAMLVGATLMVELGGLWAARKHNAADLIAATAQHGRRRPIPHAVTVLFQGVRGIAPVPGGSEDFCGGLVVGQSEAGRLEVEEVRGVGDGQVVQGHEDADRTVDGRCAQR